MEQVNAFRGGFSTGWKSGNRECSSGLRPPSIARTIGSLVTGEKNFYNFGRNTGRVLGETVGHVSAFPMHAVLWVAILATLARTQSATPKITAAAAAVGGGAVQLFGNYAADKMMPQKRRRHQENVVSALVRSAPRFVESVRKQVNDQAVITVFAIAAASLFSNGSSMKLLQVGTAGLVGFNVAHYLVGYSREGLIGYADRARAATLAPLYHDDDAAPAAGVYHRGSGGGGGFFAATATTSLAAHQQDPQQQGGSDHGDH